MKNSTKGASKPSGVDAGFAERTGVLQNLQKQFPKIIGEMIELLIAANKDCKNHLHEFAFEFDGIAYIYRRRLNSRLVNYACPIGIETAPNYIDNQHTRRDKLEAAVQLLEGLIPDLVQLDLYHHRKFISSYKNSTGRTEYNGPAELFSEIEIATRIIAACQGAYSATFRMSVKKRGRRPLPYIDVTRQLIDLWQKYTGEKVPVSKTHQHEVTTNAARFIRLGISLIDPDATDANVVTAINNALSKQ
jgi:hypothetical protein